MEELYKTFSTGIRYLLYRQLGLQELDDNVHDVLVTIAEAICNGELRDAEQLMGYAHTVVRRQVASHIDRAVHLRRNQVDVDFQEFVSEKRPDPEREAINRENFGLAMRALQSIPKRDREVLTRFYLNEESAEDIWRDMGLSETQFRLIKSRAKARFGELGRRRLAWRRSNVDAGDETPKSTKEPAHLNPNLLAHAVETFGSERAAQAWLSSECGALNNRTPLEVIQSGGDDAEVERILACIAYGMIA
jgi:RNA polymerase sigma-70 factor, ECF subfamily